MFAFAISFRTENGTATEFRPTMAKAKAFAKRTGGVAYKACDPCPPIPAGIYNPHKNFNR